MQTLRLYFKKTGDARYISHLDLVRCFSRAIRMSKLDIWYTEGFNNRPYLLFPLPLSLGIEGNNEILDIRVNKEVTNEDFERLNCSLPDGIDVYEFSVSIKKHSDISAARYTVEFNDTDDNITSICEVIDRVVINAAEIYVEKKGKKGINLTDIKSQIQRVSYEVTPNRLLLELVVDAGVSRNLNPMLIVNKVAMNVDFDPCYLVSRFEIFF